MPISLFHSAKFKNFFGKSNYYYFHPPIGTFHCAKFLKKSYSRSGVMRMCHFWAQNSPLAPNKFFWGKLLISFSSPLAPFIVQNFNKILPADPVL